MLNKKYSLTPEIIFLLVSLVFGVAYCVFVPYGAGFDEEAHIIRIYDISGYNFLPNQNPPDFNGTTTFAEFHDLSYQRRYFHNSAADMFTREALSQHFSKKEDGYLYNFLTNSIYSPIVFSPQAIVSRFLWRKLDFPIFPVVMLMRIAGLLIYVIGSFLAIRLLPYGKWVLMTLALAPMALFQASTLNADGFINAVSFLFMALTLYLWANPPYKPVAIAALFGVSLLLGSGKPGSFVLLPLLLLLTPKNFPSKKWLFLLLAGAVLAVAINLGWVWLALPTSRYGSGNSQDLSERVTAVLSDLPGFIWSSIQGLLAFYVKYVRNWLASYGYWVGTVPEQVFWFYPFGLLFALLLEPAKSTFPIRVRLFLFGMFLLTSSIIIGPYFALHYKNGVISSIRQGRYMIAYAPLLFIGLTGFMPVSKNLQKFLKPAALGCLAMVWGFYSFGLYAVYFTDCGYSVFTGNSCTLPQFKNLDTNLNKEIKVNAETPIKQTFALNCSGLQELQVEIRSLPNDNNSPLKIGLLDPADNLLASADYFAAAIAVDQYLLMPLVDIQSTKGATYTITIEAPGVPASDGFGVALRGKDVYEGLLFTSNELVKDDLLFHYRCVGP